jgi:CMP-N,N'-diacetyllegionaminic acid synthase
MRVLALITARGGSKGLPGKNVKDFHGKPLIAWSVLQAKGSQFVSSVVLSTDDSVIAACGQAAGAEIPFIRPPELSDDQASSVEVALHALDELEKMGRIFDILLLIQPTSPLRETSDIDGLLRTLIDNWDKADAAITMVPMKPSPLHSYKLNGELVAPTFEIKAVPRQQMMTYYASYGLGWAIKVDALRAQKTFNPVKILPWFVSRSKAVDIDDEYDFSCAEALFKYLKVKE